MQIMPQNIFGGPSKKVGGVKEIKLPSTEAKLLYKLIELKLVAAVRVFCKANHVGKVNTAVSPRAKTEQTATNPSLCNAVFKFSF